MTMLTLEPAFVLHQQPYRETSQLVTLLTPGHGKLKVLARGAHRRNGLAPLLQPFQPLLISASGMGLKKLTQAELGQPAYVLKKTALYSGFYLNELLARLLWEEQAQDQLYELYDHSLAQLATGKLAIEPILRHFEMQLLQILGYGLPFPREATDEAYYVFQPDTGFIRCEDTSTVPSHRLFSGITLAALQRGDFNAEILPRAKHLFRQLLHPLLGGKPLKSRDLFQTPRKDRG